MLKLLTLFHLEYFISIGDRVPHISALSFDFPPTSFEQIYPNMMHCALHIAMVERHFKCLSEQSLKAKFRLSVHSKLVFLVKYTQF